MLYQRWLIKFEACVIPQSESHLRRGTDTHTHARTHAQTHNMVALHSSLPGFSPS
jgi:hypothetical protein